MEANKVYFLRYSEIDPPETAVKTVVGDAATGNSPLVLVATEYAQHEMKVTRMLPEGGRYIKSSGPLSEDELEGVFDSRVVSEVEDVAVEDPNTMKWWW